MFQFSRAHFKVKLTPILFEFLRPAKLAQKRDLPISNTGSQAFDNLMSKLTLSLHGKVPLCGNLFTKNSALHINSLVS